MIYPDPSWTPARCWRSNAPCFQATSTALRMSRKAQNGHEAVQARHILLGLAFFQQCDIRLDPIQTRSFTLCCMIAIVEKAQPRGSPCFRVHFPPFAVSLLQIGCAAVLVERGFAKHTCQLRVLGVCIWDALQLPSAATNPPPMPVTSPRSRRTLQTLLLRPRRCCCRRYDQLPAAAFVSC